MKVEREVRIGVPREAVWAFLWDVPRLAACLPGARDVRVLEDGKRYAAIVAERVGPFKVQLPLEIEVLDVRPPERLRARAGGRDAGVDGLVKVDLDVSIDTIEGGTALRLIAEIAVLGKLGTLGHSVIVRKGAEIVDRFTGAMRSQLESQDRQALTESVARTPSSLPLKTEGHPTLGRGALGGPAAGPEQARC
jgi:carbon monoxide dehydrogenase subunit G